mmetsp:Transcript_30897/g.95409  ORF Transcript_30897/g.95409 Transcript_30897/m.95409 type:complete len:420 (-) Transcript_30897:60-1319(-)
MANAPLCCGDACAPAARWWTRPLSTASLKPPSAATSPAAALASSSSSTSRASPASLPETPRCAEPAASCTKMLRRCSKPCATPWACRNLTPRRTWRNTRRAKSSGNCWRRGAPAASSCSCCRVIASTSEPPAAKSEGQKSAPSFKAAPWTRSTWAHVGSRASCWRRVRMVRTTDGGSCSCVPLAPLPSRVLTSSGAIGNRWTATMCPPPSSPTPSSTQLASNWRRSLPRISRNVLTRKPPPALLLLPLLTAAAPPALNVKMCSTSSRSSSMSLLIPTASVDRAQALEQRLLIPSPGVPTRRRCGEIDREPWLSLPDRELALLERPFLRRLMVGIVNSGESVARSSVMTEPLPVPVAGPSISSTRSSTTALDAPREPGKDDAAGESYDMLSTIAGSSKSSQYSTSILSRGADRYLFRFFL